MGTRYILTTGIFCIFSFVGLAAAAAIDSVVVYSTQKNDGSTSIGAKSYYTKDFNVSIANLSDKEIDLSSLCLIAYSPDGKAFALDTVSDELAQKKLKPKAMVEGDAVFSSKDSSVYSAAMVKIADSCK